MEKNKYIYRERERERERELNHFAVHQKLTQHCKSTILQFKKKKAKKRVTLQEINGHNFFKH